MRKREIRTEKQDRHSADRRNRRKSGVIGERQERVGGKG